MLLKVAILLGLIVVSELLFCSTPVVSPCRLRSSRYFKSSFAQALNGPQFSQLLLRLIYGKRWAEAEGASATLGGFAAMVSFLAVNGITEAFAHAIMTPKELASANLVLLISSALNVCASVMLQFKFGALGLIMANCCTMSIRIAYTLCYVHVRFQGSGHLTHATPHSNVVIILLALSVCTWFTSTQGFAVHFGAGLLSVIGIVVAVVRWERATFIALRKLRNKDACGSGVPDVCRGGLNVKK